MSTTSSEYETNDNTVVISTEQVVVSPTTRTITLSADPMDGGTVSGDGTFNYGTSRTVTATPNAGFDFVNWTEGGNEVSTSASYNFTLTANRDLTANFVIAQRTIEVSASPGAGGTVSGAGTFVYGTERTVSASANAGYEFAKWTEKGNLVSKSADYTFPLTANRTLVAKFALKPPDLVVRNPSVSNANPEPGEAFKIEATVRNRGGKKSDATTLRYMRSNNPTIDTGDEKIGADFVDALSLGDASKEAIVRAIANRGTYWVGGCVDPVSGESPTGNNCSVGVKVVVAPPYFANDLIVSFGTSGAVKGLWRRMNNSVWDKLHNVSATAVAIGDIDNNGIDDAIIAQPGRGTRAWMNNTNWKKLTDDVASVIAVADLDYDDKDDVILAIPGMGTVRWMNNAIWKHLHNVPATAIAAGDIDGMDVDDLIVVLPGKGTYRWMNNSAWKKLHGGEALAVAIGDLDANNNDDAIVSIPGGATWLWMNKHGVDEAPQHPGHGDRRRQYRRYRRRRRCRRAARQGHLPMDEQSRMEETAQPDCRGNRRRGLG